MVVWSDYYRFSAEDVEALGVDDKTSGTHPYTLTFILKAEKTFLLVIWISNRGELQ